MPLTVNPSPRWIMRTWLRPRLPSRNSTETSERSLSFSQGNMSIPLIMKEDKKEWTNAFKKGGTARTPSSQENSHKKNKGTETISRPISKTTAKTNASNNFWTVNNFWVTLSTASTNTTSKKDTLSHRKTTRPLIWRKRCSSSSTEEPWTRRPIIKEETCEWFKDREPDLNRPNIQNWLKTICENRRNTKLSISRWSQTRLSTSTGTTSKLRTNSLIWKFWASINTKWQLYLRTGLFPKSTGLGTKPSHSPSGTMSSVFGQIVFNCYRKCRLSEARRWVWKETSLLIAFPQMRSRRRNDCSKMINTINQYECM